MLRESSFEKCVTGFGKERGFVGGLGFKAWPLLRAIAFDRFRTFAFESNDGTTLVG